MARARPPKPAPLLALLLSCLAPACAEEPQPDPRLEWEPCDHGRDFVDGHCSGPAQLAKWEEAVHGCAAMVSEEPRTGWRLPTPDELAALVRADPSIDPARRWSDAHDEEDQPISINHGGFPTGQEPDKKVRFRCVKD